MGCFALLSSWGLQFPRGALARQKAGLEAVRELKKVVDEVLRTARHPGIQMARAEARLEPLSCYDVQVQCCETKRGFSMPGRIRSTRATLPRASEAQRIMQYASDTEYYCVPMVPFLCC